MIDVFKAFYGTHYNFAAVSVLLLLLLIFLLSKKNVKVSLVILAILVVFNMAIYKKTLNKAWTIEIQPEKTEDSYSDSYVEPKKMTFSVANWTIIDDKGEKHHWCWVEDLWEIITNTDIVAWIWGENAGKKVMQSTESHVKDAENLK